MLCESLLVQLFCGVLRSLFCICCFDVVKFQWLVLFFSPVLSVLCIANLEPASTNTFPSSNIHLQLCCSWKISRSCAPQAAIELYAVEHGSQPSNDIVKCRMTAWSLETSKHSKETEMCPFRVTFCYKDVCLLCSCHSIFVEHYMTEFWWYRFLKDHADFISGRSHFCSVLCCLCF